MKIGSDRKENKISNVEITSDTLSGRDGLSFLLRYIATSGICSLMEEKSGHPRQSRKGESIGNVPVSSRHFAWMVPVTQLHGLMNRKEIPAMQPYRNVLFMKKHLVFSPCRTAGTVHCRYALPQRRETPEPRQ